MKNIEDKKSADHFDFSLKYLHIYFQIFHQQYVLWKIIQIDGQFTQINDSIESLLDVQDE